MPDTTDFMGLGLASIVILVGVFLLSLVQRARSFRKMLNTLDELEKE